jgi:hypothetical protein
MRVEPHYPILVCVVGLGRERERKGVRLINNCEAPSRSFCPHIVGPIRIPFDGLGQILRDFIDPLRDGANYLMATQ